jgi:CRP-like cAMP-binding protein
MNKLPAPFNLLPQSALQLHELNPQEVLFRLGETPWGMFFLESGEVTLIRHTRSGDDVVTHVARSGETFAEAALFSDSYHCDAIIKQPSRVWEVNKKAVLALSEVDSVFALALAARFAMQVQQLRRQKEILAIRSANERVYAALSDGMLQGSIKQFAGNIGLTHEAVYRALNTLVERKRVIKRGRGVYTLD